MRTTCSGEKTCGMVLERKEEKIINPEIEKCGRLVNGHQKKFCTFSNRIVYITGGDK
jgi:hypothetical protein